MAPKRAVLLCVLIFLFTAPVTAVSVERTLTSSENDLEVTLTVTGIPIGGIVETIPDGCTWAGTDHPDDQTRVSGPNVAFAVIGEEAICYRVQGPSEAGEEIAGTWENLQTGESGVVGSDGPKTSGEVAQTATPTAPGFEWAAALAAFAVVFGRWCRR